MAYHRLCESDYRFLSLIWDHEPVNSTEPARICAAVLRRKRAGVWAGVCASLLCLLFFAACAAGPKALVPEKTELSLNADGTALPLGHHLQPGGACLHPGAQE